MFFEDLEIGRKIVSRSRTLTATDIDLFASLTGAVNPLFLSDEFARTRGFAGRVSPGLLTLSVGVGLLYGTGLFDNIVALAGMDELVFRAPVQPGDELSAEAEVLEKREASKPDRGRVTLGLSVRKQSGETTVSAKARLVYLRR